MLIGKPKAQVNRDPLSYTMKLYVPNDVDPLAQVLITAYEDGTVVASFQKNHDGHEVKFGNIFEMMTALDPFLHETLL